MLLLRERWGGRHVAVLILVVVVGVPMLLQLMKGRLLLVPKLVVLRVLIVLVLVVLLVLLLLEIGHLFVTTIAPTARPAGAAAGTAAAPATAT